MRRAERGGCAGSLRRALIAAREASVAALTAGLLAASAPLVTAGSLAAQTPQQAQQAAADAIRRLDLQTELPRGTEPLNWHFDLPPETLWFVVAIALGVLLYAFRDLIPIWRSGPLAISGGSPTIVTSGGDCPGRERSDIHGPPRQSLTGTGDALAPYCLCEWPLSAGP
jgi:hypothetical protein